LDFNLYRFVVQLLQPHTLLHVLLLAGIALAWYRRAVARRWLVAFAGPGLLLYVTSLPVISYWMLGSLEWPYPPDQGRPSQCEAIVVLNAGIKFPDALRKHAELDTDTMLRCIHAAHLYHAGEPCYVVVTGGPEKRGEGGPTCGEVMRDFLIDLSVKQEDILVEDESLTTYENAVESIQLLRAQGIQHAVLVTDAAHMYRSQRCFEKLGFPVTPSACRHDATEMKFRPEVLLPNPAAAHNSRRVFHEWCGLLWYRLHGRI
jgi:uncharacterized SAM-binding protein YcdF (DUF218 family)